MDVVASPSLWLSGDSFAITLRAPPRRSTGTAAITSAVGVDSLCFSAELYSVDAALWQLRYGATAYPLPYDSVLRDHIVVSCTT